MNNLVYILNEFLFWNDTYFVCDIPVGYYTGYKFYNTRLDKIYVIYGEDLTALREGYRVIFTARPRDEYDNDELIERGLWSDTTVNLYTHDNYTGLIDSYDGDSDGAKDFIWNNHDGSNGAYFEVYNQNGYFRFSVDDIDNAYYEGEINWNSLFKI